MTPPLYDIKPLVAVPDNSLTMLAATVVALVAALVALLILLRRLRSRRTVADAPALKIRLASLPLDDTKHTADLLTRWGKKLPLTDDAAEAYARMVRALEPYKYRRTVPPFDAAARNAIAAFLTEIERV